MKVASIFSAVFLGMASSLSAQLLQEIPTILEERELPDDGGTVQRFLWRTDPGVRYLLKFSTDLENWTDVAGYPITADAPVEFHDSILTTTPKVFYQAFRLDEQAPTLVLRYPDNGSYAIPRFADFSINLEDATGIDPASISLTIGSQDAHTVANQPNLTLTENVISFDAVDIAHGAVGETVDVVLTVADTLGHSASYEWSFILEVAPQQLVADLTVFGSAEAQRAGQRLSASQRSVANSLIGPVRLPAGDGDTFEVANITPTQVLITYTGDTPPNFAAGRYITNLAPTTPEEIIYREITGVVNDATTKTLTLATVDVELAALVEGSVGLAADSQVFDIGQSGELQPALSLSKTIIFPTMEVDNFLAAEPLEFVTAGGSTIATLGDSNSEFGFTFTPSLTASLETKFGSLQSLDIDLGGMMDFAAVYNVTVQTPEVALEKELFNLPEVKEPHKILYLGQIGLVPVFADLRVDLTVNASLNASASLSAEFGVRRRFEQHFVLSYEKGNDLIFSNVSVPHETEPIPFDVDLAGNLNIEMRVKPSIEFLLYGVAGMSAGVIARTGVDFKKAGDEPLSAIYNLGVDLQIQPAGIAFNFLSDQAKEGVTRVLWEREWDLLRELEELTSTATPQADDGTLALERVVLGQIGADGRWNPNVANTLFTYGGNPVPGAREPVLRVPLISYAEPFASEGVARSSDGVVMEVESPPAELPPVGPPSGPAPAGFATIPAGSFVMGDPFGEGSSDERPTRTVFVSAFAMGKTEVTNGQMAEVMNWALGQGLITASSFTVQNTAGTGQQLLDMDSSGIELSWSGSALVVDAGKENYPCQEVSWYGSAAYANYLGQKEGKPLCYDVGGTWDCDFSKQGYRLPTEAEWEKAARGGLAGKRFPWGDIINHSRANYFGRIGTYSYEDGTTSGRHPDWDDDGDPATSPVGSFAANGYGLFNMSGNVWELCHDRYGTYAGTSDPTGPSAGSLRVIRGGSWGSDARLTRCASRNWRGPTYANNFIGFRLALGQ